MLFNINDFQIGRKGIVCSMLHVTSDTIQTMHEKSFHSINLQIIRKIKMEKEKKYCGNTSDAIKSHK